MLTIGLMSGTSLDGVDAVLTDFSHGTPVTRDTLYAPFDAALRAELKSLQQVGADELHRAAIAGNQVAEAYAVASLKLISQANIATRDVGAIGAHGQTVRHRPELGYTIQLNNPALLAERTGIAVVADFRSRDIAAGGQGAPLVPAFHQAVFTSTSTTRVIVNLGGIANITVLQPGQPVIGFDTGPANTLLDDWVARHLGTAFDTGGAWAAGGEVDLRLLDRLLDDPFFAKPHPKSTGQDHFNKTWLECRLSGKEAPVNVQATLAQLTARTVIGAIRSAAGTQPVEAFACGGGAHNAHLMAQLRAADDRIAWDSTAALGIAPDWVEATAFAWLAHQTISGRPGSLSTVTGARGPRILGAVYPA